jgi:hypothetical protein
MEGVWSGCAGRLPPKTYSPGAGSTGTLGLQPPGCCNTPGRSLVRGGDWVGERVHTCLNETETNENTERESSQGGGVALMGWWGDAGVVYGGEKLRIVRLGSGTS